MNRSHFGRAAVFLLLLGATLFLGSHHKAYASFSGGEGTDASPYLIMNADQLAEMKDDLTASYQLGADIDLAAAGYTDWTPVGNNDSSTNQFTGTFDGNGHTISNLVINGSANYVGLFGYTKGAHIRNVGLIHVNIEGTKYVGGLVGNLQDSNVENVYATGTVTGNLDVGGLAGYAPGSEISASYAAVGATATINAATGGGLVGTVYPNSSILNSYYDNTLAPGSSNGIGMSTTDMMSSDTYEGWDFSGGEAGHWAIVEDATYPMHRTTFDQIALGGLEVKDGDSPVALTPGFASGELAYDVRVRGDVSEVTVTATPKNESSVVSIDGAGVSEAIALNPGSNSVSITVSTSGIALPGASDNPYVVHYKLTIVREDGSASYPHSIETAAQLAAIGTGVFGLDDHYTLENDLDLQAAGYDNWDPIGSGSNPFAGGFDGGHHVIYNLSLSHEGEDDEGLFGTVTGTVRDIGLEDANVTGGDHVGALIGTNDGTVTNVYATGSVTGGSDVGGLIGDSDGTVTNAYFAGTVDGSGTVGGLTGSGSGTVTSSYWDEEKSGLAASGGGEGKTAAELMQSTTFADWDFSGAWALVEGTTYPTWKQRLDNAKLSALTVTPAAGSGSWDIPFSSNQGIYTVNLDRYVTEVTVAGVPTSGASVTIGGTGGDSATIPVTAGSNSIKIKVADADGHAVGAYVLDVTVPAPALTEVAIPAAGTYAAGDALTFTVTYEADVDVTGTPQLPLQVGADTEYAAYKGHPDGSANKLTFEYTVPEGIVDSDGIGLGAAIELPLGAEMTSSGVIVGLAFTAPDPSGILLDGSHPSIALSQAPDGSTPTSGTVTVAATIDDTGSGVALEKWAEGSRAADHFATEGTLLDGTGFEAAANGTYTVYAVDAAGNEAVQEITIGNILTTAPTLLLSHSPTDSTNGPVTVTVTASVTGEDAGNHLAKLSWLEGSHPAADFAGGTEGTDILADGQFQVSANGTYTVYALDTAGNEAVKEIAITNISTTAPVLTLSHSPTDSTNGSVTVTVTASVTGEDAGNHLAKLSWLEGSHPAADFAGGKKGTDILTAKQFQVSANGTYTVYALDAAGNEAVKEIEIANISTTAPVLTLSHSPTDSTNGSVTVTVTASVTGEDAGNHLAKLNWLEGNHPAADFAGGTKGADILLVKQFQVSANSTYTVYALDAAGNEAVKEIAITNISTTAPVLTLSHSPTDSTNGSVTVTVTASVTGEDAGNHLAKLNWLEGSHPAADFAGGTKGTDILADGQFQVSANGTYTVYALDAAGNEAVKEMEIANISTTAPVVPVVSQNPPYTIALGQSGEIVLRITSSMMEKVTQADSSVLETVKLSDEAMNQVLNLLREAKKPVVILEIDDTGDTVQVQFPASSLFEAAADFSDVVFQVKLNEASFQLPPTALHLDRLARQWGLAVRDLGVQVTIGKVTGTKAEPLEQAAGRQSLKLIGGAVDYKISVFAGEQALEVRDFDGAYLVRTIALPEGTTNDSGFIGVWFNPQNQELQFVPGIVSIGSGGRPEMTIRAPHNSVFAIAKPEGRTFADLNGHWAQAAVKQLADRQIVNGIAADRFAPNDAVTRAEFTAMLVRSLGLATGEPEGTSRFQDVADDAWYAQVIGTAVKAGLVQGVDDGHFAPNEKISREQMSVMIAQAIRLTGMTVPATDALQSLAPFSDADSIAVWARTSVVESVAAGIMSGYPGGTLAPKDYATRAQAALMLQGFLRYVGFME